MRFRRFSALLACFGIAAAAFSPMAQTVRAEDPFVVISVAPMSKTSKDISYLMRVAGAGAASGLVMGMVNTYTMGLDNKRPIGVTVSMDEFNTPKAVAFLPLNDLEEFFGSFEATIGEPDDLGDGLFALTVGGQTIYGMEKGEWFFVAQQEEHLENVPANPASLIEKLADRYDVGIRLDVQKIPQELRDMLMGQIRDAFERSLAEQLENQDEDQAELTRSTGEQSMAQLEEMMSSTEQVILGWAVDQAGKKTHLDMGVQFVEGSKMELQTKLQSNLQTSFGVFQTAQSAISARLSQKMSEEDVQQALPMLKSSFESILKKIAEDINEAQPRQAVTKLVQLIQSSLEATLKEGVIDGGAMVQLDGGLQVMTGARVADGQALAKAVKEIAPILSSLPQPPKIQFDASETAGVVFHTGSFRLPSNADEKVREVFGDEVKFVIGTAPKAVYLSLGPECEAKLKSALTQSSSSLSEVTPLEFRADLGPILRFANNLNPNPQLDKVVAEAEKYSDNDSITITSKTVPRGTVIRFSIDEGVLRAAGKATPQGGGGF